MSLRTALLMLLAASATTAAPYRRDSCGKPVVRVFTTVIHKSHPTATTTPLDISDLNIGALNYPPAPSVTTVPTDTITIKGIILDAATLETAIPTPTTTDTTTVNSVTLGAVTLKTTTPARHVVVEAIDVAVPTSFSTATTEIIAEIAATSLGSASSELTTFVPVTAEAAAPVSSAFELTTSEVSTSELPSSETIPSTTALAVPTSEPVTSEPVTSAPVTSAPVTSEPTTVDATSESPTSETTTSTTSSFTTTTATSTTRSTSTITTRATSTVTITLAAESQAASSTVSPEAATSASSTVEITVPTAVRELQAPVQAVAHVPSSEPTTSAPVTSESTPERTPEPTIESSPTSTSESATQPSTSDLDSLPDVSNSILATTDYAPTNPFLTPSLPSGFTHTLFSTTFSSSSLSDSWVVDVGTSYETNGTTGPSDWGTGEHQEYTSSSSNLGITTDSTLLMTPLYDSDTQTWTSARIETEESVDFACPEGSKLRVEASLKLGDASTDKQLGIWPAFWSLGSGYRSDPWSWPAVGEIDILESVNGLDTIWQTVHCGEADGGPCHETTGLFSSTDFSRGEWHIVAVEIDRTNGDGWEGEAIVWYVDGVETKRLKGSDVGDEDAWGRLAHDKRFLLLNVAVGGGMPDGVSGQTTPDAGTTGGAGSGMEVGYVGVYVS